MTFELKITGTGLFTMEIDTCNDGSPWVGDVQLEGSPSDYDTLIEEINSAHGEGEDEARAWLDRKVLARIHSDELAADIEMDQIR